MSHAIMNRLVVLSLFTGGLTACGGGVDDSKRVSDLTPEEAKEACLDLADDVPARTVMCGQSSIEIGIPEGECNTFTPPPVACTATVGDYRSCFKALGALSDAQLCMQSAPPAACAAVFSSGCSG